MSGTTMETFTGRYVDLADPKAEDIDLGDIAVHLSNICRFTGAVSRFYSVAEHSVRCAAILEKDWHWKGMALHALFHDAHEAYTNDISTPLKRLFADQLREIQDRLDMAVAERFGLQVERFEHCIIKAADQEMLLAEAASLKASRGVGPHWGNDRPYKQLDYYGWEPGQAELRFLETYMRLRDA